MNMFKTLTPLTKRQVLEMQKLFAMARVCFILLVVVWIGLWTLPARLGMSDDLFTSTISSVALSLILVGQVFGILYLYTDDHGFENGSLYEKYKDDPEFQKFIIALREQNRPCTKLERIVAVRHSKVHSGT